MDLFVYGTLRDPDLMAAVAGPGPLNPSQAALPDYQVRPLSGTEVPLIEPGLGPAKGVLWSGLNEAQVARLNLYEAAFGYTLSSVTVDIVANGEPHDAMVYLAPPGSVAGAGDWFLTDWRRRNGPVARYAAEEIFARDPLPTPEELARLWRMTQMRAWARWRAQRRAKPSETRHAPGQGDAHILALDPPQGDFFGLRGVEVQHRRFDGATSPRLRREVFLGIDASLVLPYDPESDEVVLVEQMRMGPLLLGDANPWVLEPVAGMIDPGETAEQAAHRECAEEAGITRLKLERITSFYPSPGSSTDYFHAFLGICDLSRYGQSSGGVASENEDLRLHKLRFDDALRLTETGEVTAGPLVTMLYWLALNRQRLRAATS